MRLDVYAQLILLLDFSSFLSPYFFEELSLLLQVFALQILFQQTDLLLAASLVVFVFGARQLNEVALLSELSTTLLVVQIMLFLEEFVLAVRLQVSYVNLKSLASYEDILTRFSLRIQNLQSFHGNNASS